MNLENRRKMEELLGRCAALRRSIIVMRLEQAHRTLRARVPRREDA